MEQIDMLQARFRPDVPSVRAIAFGLSLWAGQFLLSLHVRPSTMCLFLGRGVHATRCPWRMALAHALDAHQLSSTHARMRPDAQAAFTHGRVDEARHRLLTRKWQPTDWRTFRRGLNLGVMLQLMLWVTW